MLELSLESWKLVAWNGVSMRVPPQWEVSSLGTSYLQLEDEIGPVLELKWEQLKSFFSHKAQLKKLARISSSTPNVDFEVTSLPEGWRQALRGFEAQSFKWQEHELSGQGVILHCRRCGKATLLQFFQKRGRDEAHVPLGILHTLQDHRDDGMVVWSLFGLQAITAQRFGLVRHRFHPGHYQLEFQDGKEQISLSRWGPADVLLKGGDLLEWFEKTCGEFYGSNAAVIERHSYNGNRALQGKSQRLDTFASRLWARITRKLPHVWIRVWHLAPHNQILGVVARGLKGLDETMLEEICTNYEMA